MTVRVLIFSLFTTFLLSACGSAPQTPPAPPDTPVPPAAETAAPTAQPTQPPAEALPPEPQDLTFQAADGQQLTGRYWPGAVNPSPLIILMHWAPGDQNDYSHLAPWLQNRGMIPPQPGSQPFQQPAWFPRLADGQSYAVFTFTFRFCEGGCSRFSRDQWLLDAQAAAEFAASLPGVDPQRVLMAGASIGADGAADACLYLNQKNPGACRGAFSLSPGNYLTLDYAAVVKDLSALQPPVPAWCLYSAQDAESARVCQPASGAAYRGQEYAGSAHGMMLITPETDPSALQLLLDLLAQALP